ncbi:MULTISPECIES: S-layer homology domain-containing protein [Nostocales]|uniref:S-layer homology domain-containing protein n=3 Tax=Nostocales TaxID=1161 RepID=A0A0C1MZ95_9CYAN|nr:S-layer homology domain-containing protein [Tolypothrix bouteillei]KAF3888850.1 S-layer homology domain-containing protein [Tolypothrix bouteillei VB521301]
MLQSKRPVVLIGVAVLLAALTACANSPTAKEIEQSLAADPKLSSNPVSLGSPQASSNQQQQTDRATVNLPADFPKDIPLYPNANLQEVIPPSNEKPGASSTRWVSIDPSNIIASYYIQKLPANNWQIVQQSNEQFNLIEARRDRLSLKISIQPKTITNASPNQPQTSTEILIDYQPNSTEITQATPTPTSTPETTATEVPQPGESQFVGPVRSQQPTATPNTTDEPTNSTPNTTAASNPQEFSDLTKAPQEFQRYIRDLAELGVLSVSSNAAKSNEGIATNQFEPNKIIARRDYARWLVTANNNMYASDPAKQIRLASGGSQPAFSDVPRTDPDFPVIQGLAEAGLIPSSLSGETTAVLFRPGAPLTREQLIWWKVPLDTRQSLPNANLETIKQTWGFQDAGKIDPKALGAILADRQSAEQSNIHRVFGYTTLFQPKKPVTRAEAAATLWYFGTQSEGISAAEALKVKRPPN